MGEPTELQFAVDHKGVLNVHLTAAGKAAHSGYPHKGVSAIEILLDVLNDIRAEKWPVCDTMG